MNLNQRVWLYLLAMTLRCAVDAYDVKEKRWRNTLRIRFVLVTLGLATLLCRMHPNTNGSGPGPLDGYLVGTLLVHSLFYVYQHQGSFYQSFVTLFLLLGPIGVELGIAMQNHKNQYPMATLVVGLWTFLLADVQRTM